MSKQPNILLITADGMRFDGLGCNNNQHASSPVLDAIAKQGINFKRAYCSQPLSMPCRSTIMTGRYPSSHGVWQNGITLDPNAPNLPTSLKQAGYQTACFGKFHFRPWLPSLIPDETKHRPEHLDDSSYYGFDQVRVADHSSQDRYYQWVQDNHPQWLDLAKDPTRDKPKDASLAWKSTLPREATKSQYIADLTIQMIEQSDQQTPFFTWASFIDPHHPYNPPAPYCDMFDDVDFPIPPSNQGPADNLPKHYHYWVKRLADNWGHVDTAQKDWQRIRRMYQGKIAHVDYQIGRVLNALKEKSIWDDTIVIYLSDHGTMLGDYGLMQVGEYSQEALVHIPMIWHVPGMAGNGTTTNALASTIDIMPTLLDFAGITPPLGTQGQSLKPILQDTTQTLRDQVMIENRYGQSPPEGFRTMVTDRYKLSISSNGIEGELYDLQNDPLELDNLFNTPQASKIQADLTHRFSVELLRQTDPLPERTACW